jgi:AbrB family looped-hinge helix DNA binding protein
MDGLISIGTTLKLVMTRENIMETLKSTVTSKGQIVIPKEIRARYGIKKATIIHWIQKGEGC